MSRVLVDKLNLNSFEGFLLCLVLSSTPTVYARSVRDPSDRDVTYDLEPQAKRQSVLFFQWYSVLWVLVPDFRAFPSDFETRREQGRLKSRIHRRPVGRLRPRESVPPFMCVDRVIRLFDFFLRPLQSRWCQGQGRRETRGWSLWEET